ncbi:hypothetical protein [Streptomyces sp. NPDC088725]
MNATPEVVLGGSPAVRAGAVAAVGVAVPAGSCGPVEAGGAGIRSAR